MSVEADLCETELGEFSSAKHYYKVDILFHFGNL